MNVFSFGVERMKRKRISHSRVTCDSCFIIVNSIVCDGYTTKMFEPLWHLHTGYLIIASLQDMNDFLSHSYDVMPFKCRLSPELFFFRNQS